MIDIEIINSNNNYETQLLTVKKGTTVHELVNHILKLNAKCVIVGVYGKIKELSYTLQDKDRVEFYEGIVADPKINRKNKSKTL